MRHGQGNNVDLGLDVHCQYVKKKGCGFKSPYQIITIMFLRLWRAVNLILKGSLLLSVLTYKLFL